jgi:hypothetical protein
LFDLSPTQASGFSLGCGFALGGGFFFADAVLGRTAWQLDVVVDRLERPEESCGLSAMKFTRK